MQRRRTRTSRLFGSGAFVLALGIAGLFPQSAFGYIRQNPYDVRIVGPARSVQCDRDVDIAVTVRSAATGKAVRNQFVEWDLKKSQSSNDRLSDRRTKTDGDGQTGVSLSFGNEDGNRVVRATIATFPTTLTVSCTAADTQDTPRRPEPRPKPKPKPQREPRPQRETTASRPVARPTELPPTSTALSPAPAAPAGGDLTPLLLVSVAVIAAFVVRPAARR